MKFDIYRVLMFKKTVNVELQKREIRIFLLLYQNNGKKFVSFF